MRHNLQDMVEKWEEGKFRSDHLLRALAFELQKFSPINSGDIVAEVWRIDGEAGDEDDVVGVVDTLQNEIRRARG